MPEAQWVTRQQLIDHFGSRAKAEEAINRAALRNERPEIPWDWQEVIDCYYVAARGLAWAVANTPQVFTEEEIRVLVAIAGQRFPRYQ